MSRTNRLAIAATLMIVIIVAGPAKAVLITGNLIDEQSSGLPAGPIADFVWDFSGLGGGLGLASLTLDYVRLDTNGSDPNDPYNEYLEVLVDGVLIGNTASVVSTCVSGVEVNTGLTFTSDCDGNEIFSFDTALITDGFLNVVVRDAGGLNPVNALIDRTNGAGYAMIEIEYTEMIIPEPTTLSIISLGLAGLGYARRRVSK